MIYRYNGTTALPCTIALELSGEITDVYPAPPQECNNIIEGEQRCSSFTNIFQYMQHQTDFMFTWNIQLTLNQNDTIDAFISTTANTYDIDSGFFKSICIFRC